MTEPSTTTHPRSRAWVEVDLGALGRNLGRVADAAGPGARLLPMVKANAYGLGMSAVAAACARSLTAERLAGFGVAAVAEGEALRADGWSGRILVLAVVPPAEFERAAAARLTLALSEVAAVERWARAAEEHPDGGALAFHLEVDTGMGRAGLPWDEAAQWGPRVRAAAGDHLLWEGCFTHFHSADEPDLSSADAQWARFRAALAVLQGVWPLHGAPGLVHVANSAAAIRRGGYGTDLVRPGIFLYGGAAGPDAAPEPVVSVRARLALVREVSPGSTVGYGATYAARRRERWGTLCIGYGDGLPRRLGPAGGEVLVHGRRVPIIGRISMDATVVDLTDVPDARADDVATLIGSDGIDSITLDEVAARCGTISYEILTGLTARLPRLYLGAAGDLGPSSA